MITAVRWSPSCPRTLSMAAFCYYAFLREEINSFANGFKTTSTSDRCSGVGRMIRRAVSACVASSVTYSLSFFLTSSLQGWLQYTYLQQLERVFGIRWPIDCAAPRFSGGGPKNPESSVRNQCFATLLYLSGLLPVPKRRHILYEPHKAAAILSIKGIASSTENKARIESGLDRSEPQLSVAAEKRHIGFCVLAGLSSEDRFNTHDWASKWSPLLYLVTFVSFLCF